ncbi:FAD:protein FMN transferase [Paenibacillus sp. sgz5001063]|uniref:FAD:protein FMN transferase n=1 Tax=Paenibacillus sp. sgz5001063 TaxID=3242474 RepID=UPI0036D26490
MSHFKAMNTSFHTHGLTADIDEQAERWFHFVEMELSRFNLDSGLMRLNQSPGKPVTVSPLLFEVLNEADKYYTETGGLFNPFMGNILASAGYRVSFEQISSSKLTEEESTLSEAEPGISSIPSSIMRLNRNPDTVLLSPGYSVDLGGIAKGWSAEKFSLKLQQQGIESGVIDAGGDVILWGDAIRIIDVASPFIPGDDLAAIRIRTGAGIATSSSIKRSWIHADGSTRHHIMDPRTLQSSASDLVQVTAICPTLVQAEVYAKCLLILGTEQGIPWLEKNYPDCAAIAVKADGTVIPIGVIECILAKQQGGGVHATVAK